jgi:hypothetical protein
MANLQTSEVMQNWQQSTWDNVILYADRASKDEQHCMRMFFVEKDEKASAD